MTLTIQTIDDRRAAMGISKSHLCRRADYFITSYIRNLNGTSRARPSSLARLQQALNRCAIGYGEDGVKLAHAATYRVLLALVAQHLGLDPSALISADPGRKATMSADWMALAHARRIAFHLFNGALGFRTSDIARAASVTKAAVTLAIRDIEDRRDNDPALDDLLNRLYEALT